jgi:hypothetical protein
MEVGYGLEYSAPSGGNQREGIQPLNGFYFTDCSLQENCTLNVDEQKNVERLARKGQYDFRQHFPEAISPKNGLIRNMFPTVDYAFYNRGIWGRLDPERSKQVFSLMHQWVGDGNGRCFFTATTASSVEASIHAYEREQIRPHAHRSGCSYLDFGHITFDFTAFTFERNGLPRMEGGKLNEQYERSGIFWDSVHYMPWVYEELNNVLLNVLCNWKQQPTTEGTK